MKRLFKFFIYISILTTVLYAKEGINIGVLAHKQFESTYIMWEPTAKYLEQKIPEYSFKIVPLRFEQFPEYIKDKKIDFIITNPAYYIDLEHRFGISRVATLKNMDLSGKPKTEFGGVIISRADNRDIKNINDIKYKSFGGVNEDSFGGWIMALRELNAYGIKRKDLDVKFFGTHEAVVFGVLNGDVASGTVRTDTLERMAQDKKIELDKISVLSPRHYKNFDYKISTRLYPEWPIAMLNHTSSLLAEKVAVALISMPSDSEAAVASKSLGWTIPLDYQSIHEALRELELGPYSSLKKDALLYYIQKYWPIILSGFLLTLISIVIALYIYRINKKLNITQFKLEELNLSLEQKVQEKTLSLIDKNESLEKAYANEKYLRGILRTVADVNQNLITAKNIDELISNAIKTISLNDNFKLAKLSLVVDNKLVHHSVYGVWQMNNILPLEDIVLTIKENLLVNNIDTFEFSKECVDAIKEYDIRGLYIIALRPNVHSDKIVAILTICTGHSDGFSVEERAMIEELAGDIGFAINAHQQQNELELLTKERLDGYENIIDAMVNMIEQRDTYTAGHTKRVAEYSKMIAEHMGINDDDIRLLVFAAKLHDIGKIVTPDSILLKPGKLNKLEYGLIQEHVSAGYELLSSIKGYAKLASIVYDHHERYDGSGYPNNKKGDEISILSYIMALADSFDAMTTNRIYKPRKDLKESLKEIEELSGSCYHPRVVEAALVALKDVDINMEINQEANTVIEEERMSYFFKDRLSGLYNEDFLLMYIRGLTRYKKPNKLTIISIINFYKYNKQYGWDGGNELIAQFGGYIKDTLSDNIIFRAWGDQFVIADFDGDIETIIEKSIIGKNGLVTQIKEVVEIPDTIEALV